MSRVFVDVSISLDGYMGPEERPDDPAQEAALQDWRSREDLQRFAIDPHGSHIPAWKWYNETADPAGGLGFWAELYVVDGDSFETFFRNVPPIGIGRFAKMVPMHDHERRLGLSPDGSTRSAPSAEGTGKIRPDVVPVLEPI